MTHYRKKTLPRFYQDRKDKHYLVVFPDLVGPNGFDGVTNSHATDVPALCTDVVSGLYLLNRCKRVHWPDIPAEWQQALAHWLEDEQIAAIKAHYQNQ